MQNRCKNLQTLMHSAGLPAAWITKPENIRYLTGYTGEGCLFLFEGTPPTIITDFRYVEQAERESPLCTIERTTTDLKLPMILHRLLQDHDLTTLAFEPQSLTVSEYETVKSGLGDAITLVPLGELPESLRKVKDASEIHFITQAANIACNAFEQLLSFIQPGLTERQIQQELDYNMLKLGSEQVAFQTIACAGPNGSLPHATPSDRPIEMGELLTLDFGAQVNGYKCDMTRTLAIGRVSRQLLDIYDAVYEAQYRSFEVIRPGVICRDVDKVARDYLESRYPGAFGHSLGHGVGLEIHEAPGFSTRCVEPLKPGHVMTVEPGVYIPGLGGCRIEDMAIITEEGYINPITAPRTLITVCV